MLWAFKRARIRYHLQLVSFDRLRIGRRTLRQNSNCAFLGFANDGGASALRFIVSGAKHLDG
jgi:hypothetical protein